jgi:hypothetical protein
MLIQYTLCSYAIQTYAIQVVETYYAEMMEVVKKSSGAERVFIFDHTVRESGKTNLNAEAGGSAAPVPRVHCDYTATGAHTLYTMLIQYRPHRYLEYTATTLQQVHLTG